MIVALYIDPRGPYPALLGAENCWDEARDATKFDDWKRPVIAHPPCGPWSSLRHLSQEVTHDLAIVALAQVSGCGGVLEHPATSGLWDAQSLPKPGEPEDEQGGYTIEVQQCEWGHVARKRTWLYLVRVPRSALRGPPFPGRRPTHWCSGGRTKNPGMGATVPPGIKVCSSTQRRKTPRLFAEYLIHLASSVPT